MNEKTSLRRLAKLGIADFETPGDVQKLQADMLQRLEHSSVNSDRYVGLTDCASDHCGRINCLEACWVGTRRRRLDQIPAIHDLLKSCDGPLLEVHLARGAWARLIDDLDTTSIPAAKQLNRRALDKILNTETIAVGTFKVGLAPKYADAPHWIGEIHQIVAGVEKDDLQKAFSTARASTSGFDDILRVEEIDDLGSVINGVMKRDLEGWQHPWQENDPTRPNKAQRMEYCTWLMTLALDESAVRYGCDRHFNKLVKPPRTLRVKPKKPRPYPYWLEPYMFGFGELRAEPSDSMVHTSKTADRKRTNNTSAAYQARRDWIREKRSAMTRRRKGKPPRPEPIDDYYDI